VFYDVGSLTEQEQDMLFSSVNPEGSVLIVYPLESHKRIRTLTPWEFVQEQNKETEDAVDAIAVAGVGSSALGTAALARNVADYLHRPVAGVVSGYGMSDMLTEAWGGWFVLGTNNTLRDILARIFDALDLKDHVRDPESHRTITKHFDSAGIDKKRFIYGSPDSTSLLYLLSELGTKIKLLVGHSKGNYSIENALEGLLAAHRKTGKPLYSALQIITLGAVIRFPLEFPHVHQFLGQIDYFGMMNSRPAVARIVMPGGWHSLNTSMPGHMAVASALKVASIL
jgi:hypothetical protein